MYLREFSFPDMDEEFTFFLNQKMTCYTDFYPFQVLSSAGLERLRQDHGSQCDCRDAGGRQGFSL